MVKHGYSRFIYIHVYIYIYVHVHWIPTKYNKCSTNKCGNYSIYPRMKQNTSGPSKNSPSQKKRSEKPNVLKFCVLDREYLPTTSILNTTNCGHVPGNNQGFSRSPFSCLSCLISMSQEVDLPHFEQIPVIVGIAHILLAMGPSSYYWYHSSGQTRMVLKA